MRPFAALLALSSLLLAQDPPNPEPPKTEAPKPTLPGRPSIAEPEIKPYDKVITKDAKSTPGIFTVHQIKDKYYYEIPNAELGKDFLWGPTNCPHHPRCRLWRPSPRQPRRPLGTPR